MAKIIPFKVKWGRGAVDIFDMAKAFLSMESMTHKKLQKICYYAQAWHLALFEGEPLVNARFEAWIHGPVCPELYSKYRDYGWHDIPMEESVPSDITNTKWEFLQLIYKTFKDFTADQLESMTHIEEPWIEARGDLQEWEPSDNQISEITMRQYYFRLYKENVGKQ